MPNCIPSDLWKEAYWHDGAFSLALNTLWTCLEISSRTSDLDMIPAYVVTGTPGNKFEPAIREIIKGTPAENVTKIKCPGDMFLMHQWIKQEPVDLLVEGRRVTRLVGRRRRGTAGGTGCRLASAIAGLLARRVPLEEAARRAKRLVERYLDSRRS